MTSAQVVETSVNHIREYTFTQTITLYELSLSVYDVNFCLEIRGSHTLSQMFPCGSVGFGGNYKSAVRVTDV